jgi:hypothetical protein
MVAKKSGAKSKSGGRKYGEAASKSVKSALHSKKKGTLKSGKGGRGLSEARKKGAKVPPK